MSDAEKYGVTIVRADPPAGEQVYRATEVYHLPPEKNRGRHNIFVNAYDEEGESLTDTGVFISWRWEGQGPGEHSPDVPLDKDEPPGMGDIPMFSGQHISIRLGDDSMISSDMVHNLHTNHPSDGRGNSEGHHSFRVTFVRTTVGSKPPGTIDPPDPPDPPATALPTPIHIYGIHDLESSDFLADEGATGWVTVSVRVRDLHDANFSRARLRGIEPIVRLNYGYGSDGTIPLPEKYDLFAIDCASFVRASTGCNRWIIGNEPNLAAERPNGQAITPQSYASCFRKCRSAIRSVRGHEHDEVITAAIGPWNIQTGDWLEYFRHVLSDVECDGIALHTYTHGVNPDLVYSEDKMSMPYQDRFYHFKAFINFMDMITLAKKRLPVYITETNQNDPWLNINDGWVQNAYENIYLWNKEPATQKILALCLYRWKDYDRWGFMGMEQVQADLRAAIHRGYPVPTPDTPPDPGIPTGNIVWPVRGFVTQRWGENPDRYYKKYGIPYHNGLDIAAPLGTPVVAIAAGDVMYSDYDDGGYGNYVRIYHPSLRIHSVVAHLKQILVRPGVRVRAGEIIGLCGSTGDSSGPHVHLETRLGTRLTYVQGTFGHTRGRVDPEAALYLLGMGSDYA